MTAASLTAAEVSRVFGKVAFGATAADLDTWTGKSQEALAAHLLSIPSQSELLSAQADEPERLAVSGAATSAGKENGRTQLQAAQSWWLERMRTTRWPLLERLTLFWHDHFATGLGQPYPDVAMMMGQNQLLRVNALGSFADLVAAVTVDPAMLYWLDGARSVKGKPNENYARELLELFTMGVSPQQFGEVDIREAARALTGWLVDGQRKAAFDARRHDPGVKTVLGRRIGDLGNQEHLAVRDAALATPAAAGFVAYKLVQKLVYEPGPIDVTGNADALVARVRDALRPQWNLRAAVTVILKAPELLDPARQLARQPVEQAVHACKALGIAADLAAIIQSIDAMGQRLFDPPNVGGWPVDEEWISPGTSLARYRLASVVETEARRQADILAVVSPLPAASDLNGWARRLGLAPFTGTTKSVLQGYLESSARNKSPENQRQKSVMTLVMASPEWTVM